MCTHRFSRCYEYRQDTEKTRGRHCWCGTLEQPCWRWNQNPGSRDWVPELGRVLTGLASATNADKIQKRPGDGTVGVAPTNEYRQVTEKTRGRHRRCGAVKRPCGRWNRNRNPGYRDQIPGPDPGTGSCTHRPVLRLQTRYREE